MAAKNVRPKMCAIFLGCEAKSNFKINCSQNQNQLKVFKKYLPKTCWSCRQFWLHKNETICQFKTWQNVLKVFSYQRLAKKFSKEFAEKFAGGRQSKCPAEGVRRKVRNFSRLSAENVRRPKCAAEFPRFDRRMSAIRSPNVCDSIAELSAMRSPNCLRFDGRMCGQKIAIERRMSVNRTKNVRESDQKCPWIRLKVWFSIAQHYTYDRLGLMGWRWYSRVVVVVVQTDRVL